MADINDLMTGEPIMSDLTGRYKRNALITSALIIYAFFTATDLSSAKFFNITPNGSALIWGFIFFLGYNFLFFLHYSRHDWMIWRQKAILCSGQFRLRFLYFNSVWENIYSPQTTWKNPEKPEDNEKKYRIRYDEKSKSLYQDHRPTESDDFIKQNRGFLNNVPLKEGRSLVMTFFWLEGVLPALFMGMAMIILITQLLNPDPKEQAILVSCVGW